MANQAPHEGMTPDHVRHPCDLAGNDTPGISIAISLQPESDSLTSRTTCRGVRIGSARSARIRRSPAEAEDATIAAGADLFDAFAHATGTPKKDEVHADGHEGAWSRSAWHNAPSVRRPRTSPHCVRTLTAGWLKQLRTIGRRLGRDSRERPPLDPLLRSQGPASPQPHVPQLPRGQEVLGRSGGACLDCRAHLEAEAQLSARRAARRTAENDTLLEYACMMDLKGNISLDNDEHSDSKL